ncbi:MAG TPA: hypothetical protein PKG52_12685, partial [bacterium]|nr:hypothetical protein [bacterium]
MSRFFRSLYSIFIILALMTSCEMFDNSPGSFLISFEWPKDGKPDFSAKKYFVWVLLEEWKDGDKDNATLLMQTSAVEFDSNGKAKIDLSDVKYGDNRVVKVEIRATNKTQDRVLYFGRSELFSFSSKDKDKVVNVELQTQATPGTGGTGTDSFSLQIMQDGNVVTKINDTTVDVRIKIVNGSRVIIANSLSLLEKYINDKNSVSEGVADKALSELKAGEAGYYDLESWDLNSGLDFAADAGGERIVYGKLVNDDGYMSETVQTSVNVDKAAPAIINPVVDPNPAKLGDTVVASFSFTEPVDMNALELDWGGLEFVQAESESSNVFTYTFKVTETTGEKTYSLKGSAVDEIGNGPVEFALGDLRIDKTLPSISNETVSVTDNKSSIKTGDKVTVTFEVSEELESDPEVTIDGKKFTRNGTSDKPYSFTYTVTNSDAEGLKTVLVSLSDLARNRNVIEIGETVKFDLSSPEIINPTVTPSGDPGMAGLGNKIEIRFNISEPVKELKFFVNGTDNSVSGLFTESVKDLTYTYTRTVQPSEAASEYVFSVFALDPALNALENFELGTVSVDIEKPDVESFVLSTTNVKLMEEFSLSLDFSEELSSLAVLVGSKDISAGCIPDNLDKKKYLCGHQANKDSDEGDGVKQFSVQMVDKSGNSNTVQLKKEGGAPATIEYDVTPPEVVNPVIAPEKANLDSTIDVRFSFTENVQNLVVDWGDLAGKFTRFNEETNQKLFIYKRKVTSDDPEGVFPVVITAAQDLAGNSIAGNIAIGSVEIDNSAPEIFNSSVKVNGSALRVFVVENDLIEVSFEVHEEISDYSVRSGLKKIESCVSEAVAEGTKYTCTYSTPSSDDGEGLKDVTVEVKDIAGNSATYPVGQLTYDMSLPQLSSAIVIPEKVNSSSSVVKVQFSFSEDVQIQIDEVFIVPENLGADLPLNCDTGTDYKKSFTCLHTFSELDSRVENYIVSVKVRDKAGNQIDELFIGKVSVDREKPYLTASDVNPSAVRQSEPFTISFAVNEDLETMPVVKIGDKEISGSECAEISARNYSCTHTANGDGGETDGVKSVTVNLRDSAGNL